MDIAVASGIAAVIIITILSCLYYTLVAFKSGPGASKRLGTITKPAA